MKRASENQCVGSYQVGMFIGFNAKETMALIWGSKYITKSSRISHILGYE